MRDSNKQETHDAIVDAAERLLDRYGYSKMTMTDLAEEAGIGVGTTYLYFPGKVDVALAVLERLTERVRHRLQDIARSPETPAQKLRAMLTARLMIRYEAARTRQHQFEEFKCAVQSAVAERHACWLEAETEVFAGVLEEGRAQGEFWFDDARSTAETLMRATSCLTPKNLSQQDFRNPDEVQRKTGQLITLLMHGIEGTSRF